MSTFTQFTAQENLIFDQQASAILKKTYFRVVPGFRFYIGTAGSDRYVDVPEGFLTDGASVPFIMQWLIPTLGEYSQAATLHDFLCERYEITQVIDGVPTQVKITRKEVDAILYEAMKVMGVEAWRQKAIKSGVDLYRFVARPVEPVIAPQKTLLETTYTAILAPVRTAA